MFYQIIYCVIWQIHSMYRKYIVKCLQYYSMIFEVGKKNAGRKEGISQQGMKDRKEHLRNDWRKKEKEEKNSREEDDQNTEGKKQGDDITGIRKTINQWK